MARATAKGSAGREARGGAGGPRAARAWALLALGCAACGGGEEAGEPGTTRGALPSEPDTPVVVGGGPAGGAQGGAESGAGGAASNPAAREAAERSAAAEEPPARGDAPLGGQCEGDRNCAAGLRCFRDIGRAAGSGGVGSTEVSVAGGYCSVACEESESCAPLGEGSFCNRGLIGGLVAFCTRPCAATEPAGEKCLGRADTACELLPGEVGGCGPQCVLDSQCGSGWCDFGTGYCKSSPRPKSRSAVGSVCEAKGEFTCGGMCYGEPRQDRLCTSWCRAGGACGGSEENLCVPRFAALRTGDAGFCERRCQASSECARGLAVCAATGYRLPSGEREGGCWLASSVGQRLSLEEMLEPSVPELATAVRSEVSGRVGSVDLSANEEEVCLRAQFGFSGGGAVALTYLFGTAGGEPLDASKTPGLALVARSTHETRVTVHQADRPAAPYEPQLSEKREPFVLSASLKEEEKRAPWEAFAREGEPFDPSKLHSVRFSAESKERSGFELCIRRLELE